MSLTSKLYLGYVPGWGSGFVPTTPVELPTIQNPKKLIKNKKITKNAVRYRKTKKSKWYAARCTQNHIKSQKNAVRCKKIRKYAVRCRKKYENYKKIIKHKKSKNGS